MPTRPIPDRLYRQILENMPIVCVDVVVRDAHSRVLLVHRDTEPAKDTWWLPGGRLLKHETLADCARRKIREEVGLDVRVLKKLGVYETTFPRGPYPDLETGIHSVNVGFLTEPTGASAEVVLDETSAAHRWIDRPEPDLPAYVLEVLRDAGWD